MKDLQLLMLDKMEPFSQANAIQGMQAHFVLLAQSECTSMVSPMVAANHV